MGVPLVGINHVSAACPAGWSNSTATPMGASWPTPTLRSSRQPPRGRRCASAAQVHGREEGEAGAPGDVATEPLRCTDAYGIRTGPSALGGGGHLQMVPPCTPHRNGSAAVTFFLVCEGWFQWETSGWSGGPPPPSQRCSLVMWLPCPCDLVSRHLDQRSHKCRKLWECRQPFPWLGWNQRGTGPCGPGCGVLCHPNAGTPLNHQGPTGLSWMPKARKAGPVR